MTRTDNAGIRARIERGVYNSELPHPPGRGPDSQVARRFRRNDEARLRIQFRHDVLSALGILDHPRASRLWDMAWEQGHSSGHQEVYEIACELAQLLDPQEGVLARRVQEMATAFEAGQGTYGIEMARELRALLV